MSENSAPPEDIRLESGHIIDQRFEVLRLLSSQSERPVYLCKVIDEPGKQIAMRVLRRGRTGEDEETLVARFKREVLLTHSISHPNVISVYEFFEDGDLLAFSMEYVGGGSLRTLILDEQAMPIPRIIEILRQICAGVQEIHNLGVVHRELKPKNVLFTETGQLKLSDFGIARAETQKKLTMHGALVGTLEYMSPEYVSEGRINNQLDIYSIGVMAYEMITKTIPFQSENVFQMIQKRLSEDPPTPESLNSECPPALSEIVMKAVHRDPEIRYGRVEELFLALQKLQLPGGKDAARKRATQSSQALETVLFDESYKARPSKRASEVFELDASNPPSQSEKKDTGTKTSALNQVISPTPSEDQHSERLDTLVDFYRDAPGKSAGLNPAFERLLIFVAAVLGSAIFGYLLFFY